MRQIRVTYRAVFEQPIGQLNPMGLKLPGPFPVEIFDSGDRWQIREIASPRRQVYTKLGEWPSARCAQQACSEAFNTQAQEWQIWGTPPNPPGHGQPAPQERLILPDEVEVLSDSKVVWKEPEDYTHIIHAPTIPPGARIPPAACGAKVPAKSFISTKANLEPTCKACAHVWREHYQEKRA